MKPEISEFSYGYALTEALGRVAGRPLLPPLFPSLFAEGSLGFDVAILGPVGFLFLQFKLSDGMVSKTAFEAKQGLLGPTFFRMHFRRRNLSNQHRLLLALEGGGKEVFYAAPTYFRERDFVAAYAGDKVVDQTLFVRPSAVGPLPDDDEHHLAFVPGGPIYFCSEPKRITSGVYFGEDFSKVIREKEKRIVSNADLVDLAAEMKKILLPHDADEQVGLEFDFDAVLSAHHPLQLVRFISRTYFGAEFLIV